MASLINHAKALAVAADMRLRGERGRFAFLRQDTARLFPNNVPQEACVAVRNRIDEVLAGQGGGRIWRDATGSDSRIFQFEHDIPDLLSAFDVEGCIEGIDAYLGKRTHSWLLMANKVVPRPGNAGSGGGFHRDSPFSHQVKCIWYMSDVDETNGPFAYVPGTHRNLIAQKRRYPLGTYRFVSVPDRLEPVTAPAGTLLVCDTRAIHGGLPIEAGARYAVTLYTFATDDAFSQLIGKAGLRPDEDVPLRRRVR